MLFKRETNSQCRSPSAMQSTESYHPSLFSRRSENTETVEKTPAVPQNTLYDVPVQPQVALNTKHVTIFGFSPQNRANVLALVRKTVQVERKEEGKNYVNVWAEDPAELDKLVKLNHTTVSDEIIGVIRRNFGPVEDKNIYASKKGILQTINEYLFGK